VDLKAGKKEIKLISLLWANITLYMVLYVTVLLISRS